MRVVIKLVGGLLALVVLAGAALALILPRVIDSPQVREAITSGARDQLGREFDYEGFGVGLLPPSLVIVQPRVAGPTASDSPLLRADSVDLRVAFWPLLRGLVVIDSLVVERAMIELIRTAEGISLPTPPQAGSVAAGLRSPATPSFVARSASLRSRAGKASVIRASAMGAPRRSQATGRAADFGPGPRLASTASAEDPSAAAGAESPVALAIRSVILRDSEIVLIDRSITPGVTWVLDDVNANAEGSGPDAPIALEVGADLRSGGSLAVTGSLTLAGDADLELSLTKIALSQAAPYVGPGTRLDAALSGEIGLVARAAMAEKATAHLELDVAEIAVDALRVLGSVALDAELAGDPSGATGTFRVDAQKAHIAVGDGFTKPEGEILMTQGRFTAPNEGALEVEVDRLQLKNMKSTASLRAADTTSVIVKAPPFDLKGWGELIPALAPYDVGGTVELRDLSVQAEPLELGGQVVLDGLTVDLPDAGMVTIEGKIAGWGDGFHLVDFDLGAADQHLALSGKVFRLTSDQLFELSVASVGVLRANPLVSEVSTLKDTLYGPLEMKCTLTGRAGEGDSDTSVLDSLRGGLSFRIGEGVGGGTEGGRLAGVSVLRSTYEAFESVQRIGQVAGIIPADLERYFGDEFQHIEGRFDVADGHLETHDLRAVYRDYGVNLRGRIALADQSLDMTGEVELGSDFVALLGSQAADREIVVPLAHVGGTTTEPEVQVSKEAAQSVSRQLLASNKKLNESVDQVGKEIDRYVPNLSDALKKDLGGLLNGGR